MTLEITPTTLAAVAADYASAGVGAPSWLFGICTVNAVFRRWWHSALHRRQLIALTDAFVAQQPQHNFDTVTSYAKATACNADLLCWLFYPREIYSDRRAVRTAFLNWAAALDAATLRSIIASV